MAAVAELGSRFRVSDEDIASYERDGALCREP